MDPLCSSVSSQAECLAFLKKNKKARETAIQLQKLNPLVSHYTPSQNLSNLPQIIDVFQEAVVAHLYVDVESYPKELAQRH